MCWWLLTYLYPLKTINRYRYKLFPLPQRSGHASFQGMHHLRGYCHSNFYSHRLVLPLLNFLKEVIFIQFSSVAQSCPTLSDPMNRSMPGLPVHHYLPEFTQTHIHWVRDAIHPSHLQSSPSLPAPNPSQRQNLLQWVNSSHEVAKVLEFQL